MVLIVVYQQSINNENGTLNYFSPLKCLALAEGKESISGVEGGGENRLPKTMGRGNRVVLWIFACGLGTDTR